LSNFGEKIRKLRSEKKLPLRSVAGAIGIDVAILSKLERGVRLASRDQVLKLSDYFQIDQNLLLKIWLSDKILQYVEDEEMSLEAIQLAEEKITYKRERIASISEIKSGLGEVFQSDSRIQRAWIFGSFSRLEADDSSDLDLMIEVDESSTFSLFDLADIQYRCGKITGYEVDIVLEGSVKPFAIESVYKDLILIYEK
jgi:predicted nucleotidyltransferase